MSNIAFDHEVYERVPLPPATDTIGSDYFLIHLVHDAALPGVLHNRHIQNYYTPFRRTDAGFRAYQMRFVKFLLSMLYLNDVYGRMGAAADTALLDEREREQMVERVGVGASDIHAGTFTDGFEPFQNLDRAADFKFRSTAQFGAFESHPLARARKSIRRRTCRSAR